MPAALLNYRVDGNGPAVLLLHPVGLDLESWDALLPQLAGGYRLVRLDLAGHGRSPPTTGEPDLADYAADVHRLIGTLGIAPALVVGLSFGGMVAQVLALEHPGDVSALVLAGCPSTFADAARPAVRGRGEAAAAGMEQVVDTTLARWFTPAFLDTPAAATVRRRLLADDPREWAAAWRAISRLDTAPRLRHVGVPVLCVAGSLDLGAPPAVVETMASHVASARYVVLDGVPHMMQIEGAALFGRTVRAFLDAQRSG